MYLNLFINGCWNNVDHYMLLWHYKILTVYTVSITNTTVNVGTNAFKREYSIS